MGSFRVRRRLLIVPLLAMLVQLHQAFGSSTVYQRGDSVPLFANKACNCLCMDEYLLNNKFEII